MAIKLNPFKMNLPTQLVLMTILIIFLNDYISVEIRSFCYAVSLALKEILVFFLPIIIFSYLSSCILSFKRGVVTFIAILMGTVYVSNVASTFIGYYGAKFALGKFSPSSVPDTNNIESILTPAWDFSLPVWIQNDYALFAGLAAGIIFSFFRVKRVEAFVDLLKFASNKFLSKFFIPSVPIFILGFILKLQYEGLLKTVVTSYASVYFFTFGIETLYVLILFFIAAKFNFGRAIRFVRNALPSAIAGFSAMSSAAAMPLTLEAAERNTGNPNMARALIPATVNIHMIGNCITIPVMAVAFLFTYNMPMPDISTFFMFSLQFAIAQFAVAAVPAGGIVVMIPLLEQYMGFNSDMISVLTTIYMMFDTTITSTNILGNGVFSIFLNKLFAKLKIGVD